MFTICVFGNEYRNGQKCVGKFDSEPEAVQYAIAKELANDRHGWIVLPLEGV